MSGDGGTGAGQAEVVGDGVESEQSQTWLVTDDCAGGGTKIGMGKRNITC